MKGTAGKKTFLCNLSWSQATLTVFLSAAGYLLWTEHKAHILGALPLLIFLFCPLMHIVMHKRHGWHGGGSGKHEHEDR